MSGLISKFSSWKTAFCCRMIMIIGTLPCLGLSGQEASQPKSASRMPSRVVAIRYRAERLPNDQQTSLNSFINNNLQSLHARRVILPDPSSTTQKEAWLAAAKALAAAGLEVWVELSPEPSGAKHGSADPGAQLLDPAGAKSLETSYLKQMEALAALRTDKDRPVVGGFFLPLVPAQTLPGGWDVGLSGTAFRNFLNETGLEREWAARLTTQADRRTFVRSAGLVPWLAWRSRKVADFYSRLADQTQALTGLGLCVASPAASGELARSLFEEAERSGSSPLIAWRWMAFDPTLWKRVSGLELVGAELIGPKTGAQELAAHPDVESAFSEWDNRGQWLTPSSLKPITHSVLKTAKSLDTLSANAVIVAAMARRDVPWMIMDHEATVGQEAELAEQIAKFQALPPVTASAGTSMQLQGLTIRSYPPDKSTVIAFFNPLPCRMDVEMTLAQAAGATAVLKRDSELELSGVNDVETPGLITISIVPKSWGRIELSMTNPDSVGFQVKLPDEAREVVQTRYEELLGHRSGAVKPVAGGLVAVGHMGEKTRGRRLMAALQAYRESRLADFFRLSDGILPERRSARGVESTARGFQDDLSDRPKIR